MGPAQCERFLQFGLTGFPSLVLGFSTNRGFPRRRLGNVGAGGVSQVESPHIFQITSGKTLAEFRSQLLRQAEENFLAIFRTTFPLLLLIDDMATNLKAGI